MDALEGLVPDEAVRKLARDCGLVERERVITGPVLIRAAVAVCARALVSLESWAADVASASQRSVSRQAIDERFGGPVVEFFRAVLAAILLAKARVDIPESPSRWKRILVQDSTVFPPPSWIGGGVPRQLEPVR